MARTKQTVNNKLICTCCGKEKREMDFYMSNSQIHRATNRLSLCKDCLGDMYDKYYAKYKDIKLAIYYMCRCSFICFNISCFNAMSQELKNDNKDREPWRLYMTKLNSLGKKNGAGNDFDYSDSIEKLENNKNVIEDNDLDVESVIRWGNLPKQDLEFLDYNYTQWVTRHKCETRAEEILFGEICQTQLDIKKTRETGGDTTKKVESLQKLMGSANIRPLDQNALNVNENLMMWGTTVQTIEKDEPCEVFEDYRKKEYEDYMGYKGYFYNWVLRPLKNLLSGSKDFNVLQDEKDMDYEMSKTSNE